MSNSKKNKSSQQGSRKTTNTSRKSNTDGNVALSLQSVRLPPFKQLNFIMPDKLQTRLSWNGIQSLVVTTGNASAAYRYRPTAAYDIDPLLGTTAMPGYGELAQFYGSYRVVQSRLNVQICSPTTGTASCVIVPLNQDPGASPTIGTIRGWAASPYNRYKIVPASGSPPTIFDETMSTEKMFGTKAVYFDDNFASLTNTVPTNNWFWGVGVLLPVAVGGNQGYTLLVKVEVDVEFFNRNFLVA